MRHWRPSFNEGFSCRFKGSYDMTIGRRGYRFRRDKVLMSVNRSQSLWCMQQRSILWKCRTNLPTNLVSAASYSRLYFCPENSEREVDQIVCLGRFWNVRMTSFVLRLLHFWSSRSFHLTVSKIRRAPLHRSNKVTAAATDPYWPVELGYLGVMKMDKNSGRNTLVH